MLHAAEMSWPCREVPVRAGLWEAAQPPLPTHTRQSQPCVWGWGGRPQQQNGAALLGASKEPSPLISQHPHPVLFACSATASTPVFLLSRRRCSVGFRCNQYSDGSSQSSLLTGIDLQPRSPRKAPASIRLCPQGCSAHTAPSARRSAKIGCFHPLRFPPPPPQPHRCGHKAPHLSCWAPWARGAPPATSDWHGAQGVTGTPRSWRKGNVSYSSTHSPQSPPSFPFAITAKHEATLQLAAAPPPKDQSKRCSLTLEVKAHGCLIACTGQTCTWPEHSKVGLGSSEEMDTVGC